MHRVEQLRSYPAWTKAAGGWQISEEGEPPRRTKCRTASLSEPEAGEKNGAAGIRQPRQHLRRFAGRAARPASRH